jgi:sulfofructose kinase
MASNAAAAIGRLGAPVELWSHIGADEAGVKIRKFLEAEGVDVRHLKIYQGARSSTSAVIVDGKGERLIIGERDHAMPMDAGWLPLDRIAGAAAVLSDLRWVEGTRAAFVEARARGVTTMLDGDVGGGDVIAEFLCLVDYAIFSGPALDDFAPGPDDAQRLACVLATGVRHAGVTRGAEGYSWASADGASGHQPAAPVNAVDTTGAGDAFHGGFAWALMQGCEQAECARIAAAVAALKCQRLGARSGLPTLAELNSFLASEK